MPSPGPIWALPGLPGLLGVKIVKMSFFFSIEETRFQGGHREGIERSGRSGRHKHNHLFSMEVREENFVFANVARSQFS
jgi:hypothetical protein